MTEDEETLTAALTHDVYFRAMSHHHPGRRFPAGTIVTVRETPRGELLAVIRDGVFRIYKAKVSHEDLDPDI